MQNRVCLIAQINDKNGKMLTSDILWRQKIASKIPALSGQVKNHDMQRLI